MFLSSQSFKKFVTFCFRFEHVPLVTPNGDVLVEELNFEVLFYCIKCCCNIQCSINVQLFDWNHSALSVKLKFSNIHPLLDYIRQADTLCTF